jgi:hypothetical protein
MDLFLLIISSPLLSNSYLSHAKLGHVLRINVRIIRFFYPVTETLEPQSILGVAKKYLNVLYLSGLWRRHFNTCTLIFTSTFNIPHRFLKAQTRFTMQSDKLHLFTHYLPLLLTYAFKFLSLCLQSTLHQLTYRPLHSFQNVLVIGGSFTGVWLARRTTDPCLPATKWFSSRRTRIPTTHLTSRGIQCFGAMNRRPLSRIKVYLRRRPRGSLSRSRKK